MAVSTIALKCPQCGGGLSSDRRFCAFCGTAVTLSDDQTSFIVIGLVCQSCRANNQHGERFCGECSASLVMACAEPGCHAENSVWKKFCSRCGADIRGAHKRAAQADVERYTAQLRDYESQLEETRSRLVGARRRQVTVKVFIGLAGCFVGLLGWQHVVFAGVVVAIGVLIALAYSSSEVDDLGTSIKMCAAQIDRLRESLASIRD